MFCLILTYDNYILHERDVYENIILANNNHFLISFYILYQKN